MKNKLRKTFFKLLLFGNIILVILLLLSNLAPFLDPVTWWSISLLGLGFPVFLILTAAYILPWLFIRPKYSYLSLAAILISIPAFLNSFALNKTRDFNIEKPMGSIRVVTWNVGMIFTSGDTVNGIKQNKIIFDKIKELNADVVCMQEFFTPIVLGNHYYLRDSVIYKLGYPYHYFSKDGPYFGSIIFSKFQMVDTLRSVFANPRGAVIKTSLLINNDTVDIFTSRLQSVNFRSNEYEAIDNIKKADNKVFGGVINILKKLKYGYRERAGQVDKIDSLIKKTNRPVIFAGDLNDVPTGYAYSKIKNNMTDVWLNKGFGSGRTFKYISPTLRIDYIFLHDQFKNIQTGKIITSGSDHYGIVTDCILRKKSP
ncbi:MAG: endonuclease/exonuclease/phosphatase family protein [Ferruginibacter sp.]